ncbi:hypothetical protein SAMN05443144_1471 [Fodinibius roseus]|uniref:Uncharacterized protein n=2 Tax=Fodinibius roseus TaxID=1194090 RepID=A0A1M5LY15_9BACT|nr:hypothetical protein SAMN05443144_1471 [Fodinibius roseus]
MLKEPFNPLLAEKYNDHTKPSCYIGAAKDPFEEVSDFTNKAFRNKGNLSMWLRELKGVLNVYPDLIILESTVSTYTSGDALKLLKAWRWAAYISGYHLRSNQQQYYRPENYFEETDSHQDLVAERYYTINAVPVYKKIMGWTTHKQTTSSIKPYFPYSLVLDDESLRYFDTREERLRALDKYLNERDDWTIPENPKQYKQHLAIVDEKASRKHPLTLAKWKARPILEKATSWKELKEELWAWRWTIHPQPRGGILFNGKYRVRLKKINLSVALEKLNQRLGQL